MFNFRLILKAFSVLLITSSGIFAQDFTENSSENVNNSYDLTTATVNNITAYISPQCYTKTSDSDDQVHNPCYSCHTKNKKPNYLDDSDLQQNYAFPQAALENPWTNLFVNRQQAVDAISDSEVLAYIRQSNYLDNNNQIILKEKLENNLPENWDFNKDGKWTGYIPDALFSFDALGLDTSYSGWRAFAYYPFLGTFWPTNGSTDDVLIRLDSAFWTTEQGEVSVEVYDINLAIIFALVTRTDVTINPVDETKYNVDLDKNGELSTATQVTFDWAPLEGKFMSYIGQAKQRLDSGTLHLAAGLFPEGTEFLHSVRYIGVDENNSITLANRMKELRYAKKASWYNYSELKGIADRELTDREVNADSTKTVPGDYENGMFTQGWLYQAFIEDSNGDLRPQSQEETLHCMGCHGGIGATTDTIFSFPRKFRHNSFQNSWYHWSQKGIKGIAEPIRDDGVYEYSLYLKTNKSGSEFRSNKELNEKFFDSNGELKQDMLDKLHDDISVLLLPSAERALTLNKAYWTIVKEQSFTKGRDATVLPQENVHQKVNQDDQTGIIEPQL